MFKFKGTFVRRFVIFATLIVLMFSLSLPVFAAEKNGFSYSGNSYNAVVKYGVNLRDKNNNIISYIGANTNVRVLGTYNMDSSRVVVEYGNTVGTVLGIGLKKSATPISELKYIGNSYNAIVKYGLNLRNKDNGIISYLKSGTNVYVLGIYVNDSTRAVVEYNGVIGTVLNVGLKKSDTSTGGNQSSSELTYSGNSYYGKVKHYLNVRDGKDNIIGTISQNEVVHVLGTYNKDATRVVIEYGNNKGTVLKAGLTTVSSGSSGGNISNGGNSYYAVTTAGLNMRDSNGNLICYLPKNSLVCVKNVYEKDKSRVVISFYGIEGNVLKSGVKEVKDAVFTSIYRQKVTIIKNGKLVAQSDCVTGKENVRNTRRGVFKVEYMQRNRTLRGTNYKGEKYAQPVEYWVRFYGNTGFHSATYRSSFGGIIYKTNGSNGCVNLPYEFAKTLYNNAYIGMPVYVA